MGSPRIAAMASLGLGAVVAGVLTVTVGPASAGGVPNATIEVTTTDDLVNAEDGVVSLREAFAQASTDTGDDTIALSTELVGSRFEAGACDETRGDFDHADSAGALTIEGGGNAIAVTCGERTIDSASTGLLTLRDLTIEDSGFSPPSGEDDGGGVLALGDVLGENLVLRQNDALHGAVGGGLATPGDVELRGSIVAQNSSGSFGGGVSASSIVLIDTIVRRNTAANGGGLSADHAVTVSGSTFRGNSAVGNPGAHRCCGDGGGILTDGGEVRLVESTMINNYGGGSGGAINGGYVSVRESVLRGNAAGEEGSGGAVYAEAPARIVRSTIRENRAGSLGGGVRADRVDVLASTVSGNKAQVGGGIWSVGGVSTADSTIAANTAYSGVPGDGRGGGIFAKDGSVSLLRSTVVANRARGGANVHHRAGPLTLRATVIGRAIAGTNCGGAGSRTSHGFNVADATGPCGLTRASDRVLARLNLGPLADNGGPTLTSLPLDASLSVIPPASCPTVPDQRGVTRPQGPRCEAGSVEVE